MLEAYQGILRNDRIEWHGDAPTLSPADQGVRVYVILVGKPESLETPSQGERMVNALRKLSSSEAIQEITDPVEWQREVRRDRELPGRES